MPVSFAIFKREMKSYFTTPVAYVYLVVFLLLSSFLTIKGWFFEARQADLQPFFSILPILFIFFIPAVGMRVFAEEKKSATIELLFTLPITFRDAVIGKFLAAWGFLLIALLMTLPLPIVVSILGKPDPWVVVTGYLGAFLLSGCYLAVSVFCSAMTRGQIESFILSVLICGFFASTDQPAFLNTLSALLPSGMVEAVANLSFISHFESIKRGVLEFNDLAYYAFIITGWLLSAMIILDVRKEPA
jgi:ABC-2 type transport system permease protein